MAQLIEDCLRIIFIELESDPNSLYSCILVNKLWCKIAIPILWKNPYKTGNFNEALPSYFYKLYKTIIYLLPTSSIKLLCDNNDIKLFLPILPIIQKNRPSFNYISFSSKIPTLFIENVGLALTKKEAETDNFAYEKLEREIYKLFINNCKNIKEFCWITEQPLPQYSGASTCFSQLCTLTIHIQKVTSTTLSEMAQICQHIEDLTIYNCNGDIPGLISFIDIQRNLQSLFLYFKNVEKQCTQLSEVIERKASTLKKIIIRPIITSISPKFLPSLINLEYLDLNDEMDNTSKGSVKMQEWDKYLSIASFPKLQYLETGYLPICNDYKLIENSFGNILEIQIYRYYEDTTNFLYNQKLIKAIIKNCPNIENLRIDAVPENLIDVKEIFLNCKQLRTIYILLMNDRIICDELLEILINISPKNLYEISFNGYWNFSVNGLRTFFENWRGRIPLKFTNHCNLTKEHMMIVDKYRNEGVII